jgi:hypothetical protein
MSGGRLNADVEQYRQAAAMNTPPPQTSSDSLVSGATPTEQLLRILGIAANLGDQQDNATSAEQHAERDTRTREAAEKFAALDEEAAAELGSIDGGPYTAGAGTAALPDPGAATAQQIPQLASVFAGALAGAVGGALQPLAQLPQQAAQGMQQALQTGMGLFQQAAGGADASVEDTALAEDFDAEGPLTEDFDAGSAELGSLGGDAGGDIGTGALGAGNGGALGSLAGTAPTAYLGPPPAPSAGTAPSAAPVSPPPPATAAPPTAHGTAGMAGMPMVPPGATAGTSAADRDVKPDTKRVSVPPVRNGAPVQGRLTVPPAAAPVVRKSEGKPVVTRRIAVPANTAPEVPKPDS